NLGSDGDFFAQFGKKLPALGVDGPLEMFHFRPFAVSCHKTVSLRSALAIARVNLRRLGKASLGVPPAGSGGRQLGFCQFRVETALPSSHTGIIAQPDGPQL